MLYHENIKTIGIITPAGRLAPELLEAGISALKKEGLRVRGPAPLPECKVAYLADAKLECLVNCIFVDYCNSTF